MYSGHRMQRGGLQQDIGLSKFVDFYCKNLTAQVSVIMWYRLQRADFPVPSAEKSLRTSKHRAGASVRRPSWISRHMPFKEKFIRFIFSLMCHWYFSFCVKGFRLSGGRTAFFPFCVRYEWLYKWLILSLVTKPTRFFPSDFFNDLPL